MVVANYVIYYIASYGYIIIAVFTITLAIV